MTEAFVHRWLACLEHTFRYEVNFPCARVRSLRGTTHWVCVPLLSYAHLDAAGAALAAAQDRRRRVRYLAPLDQNAPSGTPVVSVLPLHPWPAAEALWEQGLSSNLRKKIRRAARDGIVAEIGCDATAAESFHRLYAATMHRHGTPPLPCALFRRAMETGDAEVHLVRQSGSLVAAYLVLFDPNVALFAWAGFESRADVGYASLVGEWSAVQSAFRRGCACFDFGRAPLGSASWNHKQYWRPASFHATQVPAATTSIYKKYTALARVWRRLPEGLARRLGPSIIRRLPDA